MNYEVLYDELLQFLYRTPWGLVQCSRVGFIQMLNPVAAKTLMPMTSNGRLDNIFELLACSRPELRSVVANYKNLYGVICEDLPLHGCHTQPIGPGAPQRALSVSIFAQNADCLMIVLRESQLLALQGPGALGDAALDALLQHDRLPLLKTRQRRVHWCNAAAQRLLQRGESELVECQVEDLFDCRLEADWLEQCLAALMAGGPYRASVQLRLPGAQSDVQLDITAVLQSDDLDEIFWILL